MDKKFTLLVIDCQNDFTNERGSMYVPTCERAIPNICKFIKNNAEQIDRVILTKDNHPENHCSFSRFGGGWPKHCVEGTWGNEIDKRIINVLEQNSVDYYMLNKGEVQSEEEYSASMYSEYIDGFFVLKTATDARKILTDDIVVCGVTGDYCVKETLLDIIGRIPEENINIYLDGVASIDSTEINNLIEEHFDIKII